MIHINLLSREQLDSLDLREPHAIVTRRRRVLSYVPCAVVWTLTLWILVCVGLWFFAMVSSVQAGETCHAPAFVDTAFYLANDPGDTCYVDGNNLENLGEEGGYILVRVLDARITREGCKAQQLLLLPVERWRVLCVSSRGRRAERAADSHELQKRREVAARLLARMKGGQP